MTKILNENSQSDYAKRILAVEDCMRDQNVRIAYYGAETLVEINGQEFRCKSTTFPRCVDDEYLMIIE